MKELAGEPFFLTEKHENYRRELDAFLETQSLALTPALEIGSTDFIIRQIKENGGISYLPYFAVAEGIGKGELAVLEVEGLQVEMYQAGVLS